MDRRQLLTAATAFAAATPNTAYAERDANDIVRSWFGTVTATNPPLGQFHDLISFHRMAS